MSDNDIAIIGIGVRVPGARNAREFWQNLRGGVESIRTVSPEELVAAGEKTERIRKKNYVPRTAELSSMEMFDAEFFGLSPKEAAIMDPQHRHFLECAWEAMEDACRTPEYLDGPVGVFAGCGMGSYFYFNVCSHKSLVDETGMFLLRHTGNDKDFLSTRASFVFDLHGPSVNVQTACSTSLVAVHYASQSLLNGECDMALAGGSTIELPHRRGYLHQEGEILSPDGHCRAFDHRAAGTVFGSGTGVVVLRRLSDAIADGDPIRAVIKSTAINNDGASKAGYLAPSVSGQASAIVEALGIADIAADTIQYVECHGTGTYLGDPIEIEALTQAFRQTTQKTRFCRVGSVKTNIGHLDTAAGVVSLIKAALSLENREIAPSLGYEKPNPAINFEDSPFIVNDVLTPWPETPGPRRASVNSLGVGGTNAHAVLQEAPTRTQNALAAPDKPQILLLSARNAKALDDAAQQLGDHLRANPDLPLHHVSYSLAKGRRRFDQSRVVAVADRQDAVDILKAGETKRLAAQQSIEDLSGAVFLFPGGGAQYPGMGRALYAKEPAFRATVNEGLAYLDEDVSAEIRKLWLGEKRTDAARQLLRPSLQLPAILIIEVAIARMLAEWGITPSAMIGHSMGENAAACVAGVLSFEDAVRLVHLRGTLFDEIGGGGMLSVALPHDELKRRLPETLDIASINAPGLCVVSGSNEELDKFKAALQAEEIEANRVPIDIAAHSRQLEPILSRFEARLRSIKLSAPQIPIISNLSGNMLTAEQATDPLYWTKHLRSTVRFADCLKTVTDAGNHFFVEVGPGRALSSLAKAQGTIPAGHVANSLPHEGEGTDDQLHLLTMVGRCWAAGLPVKIDRQWEGSAPRRISLPTYPFQHQRYFLDVVEQRSAAHDNETPVKIADISNWGWRPVWKLSTPDTRLGADKKPTSWLIFLGDTDLGLSIAARLREAGHSVKTVAPSDSFAKLRDDAYTLCDEIGRPGYVSLLEDLAAQGQMPERILHLGLFTTEKRFRPGSSFFHRNQECGFFSLFYLGQALAEIDPSNPVQITVITNGMQRVGSEPLPYPEKATVLGPAQVLQREMPSVSVRVIDLPMDMEPKRSRSIDLLATRRDGAGTSGDLIDELWDELFAEYGNEIVAYRDGRRWKHDYEKLSLEHADAGMQHFRESGVYLLTGGLGDLGSIFARELAERFKAKLILLGRTELPERESWDDYLSSYGHSDRIGKAIVAIMEIEKAGGEVVYACTDVTDEGAVTKLIARAKARFGAIHGVLHMAGTVKDELIQLKDPSEVNEVFAPKVMGTVVLANALADEQLDIVVLFSSTSTDITPAGQVDYVGANAFLNAFAESRYTEGGKPHVVAIHWGVWKDAGLAARAVQLAEQEERAPASVSTLDHHLFDRRTNGLDGGEALEGRWDAERQWILNEHRLVTGEALWPGTGYIETIAQALAVSGIDSSYEISDLIFLRALHIPDQEARIARVSLERLGGGRYKAVIESKSAAEDHSAWVVHAEAAVRPHRGPQSSTADLSRLMEQCSGTVRDADGVPLVSAQEAHLNFGPRWKVLRALHLGRDAALARLSLADAYSGDVTGRSATRLHPALMDIATGFAMELIPGYDPKASLWVPMSYGKIRVFRSLPQSIWSHVRLDKANDLGGGYAVFDVTIFDDDGQALVDVEKFTVKRLAKNAGFAASLSQDPGRASAAKPVAAHPAELSPALARLAAQVDQGIAPAEGMDALLRAVGSGLPQVIVSSMDLPTLQRAVAHTEKEAKTGVAFERPSLDTDFVGPRNAVEEKLAEFWSELLGVQKIGVNDNFFDLGGHSLIAVRLFRMIKKAFAVDFPISVLFEAPTIAQCAELVAQKNTATIETIGSAAAPAPTQAFVHLVPMQPGKNPSETPLFVCAGMFGNILNLRHLAIQVGQDRPVYGLQARGLYGDHAPHETFEEMARDYIEEIRAIQPEGPYLLSGFSGGGLVAFEMAQQLTAAGEEVAMLTLLDTPFPERVPLSMADRVAIRTQDIRREGPAFFIRYVKWRVEWERQRIRDRNAGAASGEQFHSKEIQAAFLRALWRYQAKPYDGNMLLLRPKLRIAYRLSGGRLLNPDREPVHPDNGWSAYGPNLAIIEVPGDHDAMVLEPNVRVLAGYLRKALDQSEWGRYSPIAAE